ncbi:MAG: hypothetical protein ACLP5H_01540 [Desulfomonilaceae bacterium]
MPKVIENRELRFICPECENEGLYLRKEVICDVTAIFSDGRIESGNEYHHHVVGYECSVCLYEIAADGERITDPECLIEWLINSCPQSDEDSLGSGN